MRNADPLADLLVLMSTEVGLVKTFTTETLADLKGRSLPKPDVSMTPEELKDFQDVLIQANESLLAQRKRKGQIRLKIVAKSERVGSYFTRLAGAVKHEQFFSEMALSYLISFLEAFVKDYAQTLLLLDKRRLISSASITYEELSRHKSLPAVWRAAAAKEAESIGYASIDDVASYYKKKFLVDITTFESWQDLRELVYRRNLVVHNRGRVNEIYKKKTGYSGKEESLLTNAAYIEKAAEIILSFFGHVHAVCSKLGEK